MNEKLPIGRKPEWRLKVKRKSTGESAVQGGAWNNEDGSITIKLDCCCTITQDADLLITLFPNK